MCGKCRKPIPIQQRKSIDECSMEEWDKAYQKIKIRRTWNIKPVQKVKQSKRIYNRKLTKKELQKVLKKEDF